MWFCAAAAQSRASPEQHSAGRPLLRIRKFPGGSRGPAGYPRESQPALRAPASNLSLGRPRAPAPLREGGGILNKVPSPGPGGRGRSLVTRCPRHTPAASAEGRAGSARGWGVGGEGRPGCGSPSLSSLHCASLTRRGAEAWVPSRLCHWKAIPVTLSCVSLPAPPPQPAGRRKAAAAWRGLRRELSGQEALAQLSLSFTEGPATITSRRSPPAQVL